MAKKHRASHGSFGAQKFQVSSDVFINFEDRGGLMGFEILPIEPDDEERFDIFPITSPEKWRPSKFINGYYDPSDSIVATVTDDDDEGYPALLNHTSQMDINDPSDPNVDQNDLSDPNYDHDRHNDRFDMTSMTQPIIESHILATATYHRATHKDIPPSLLRPYLGYRPESVVKKTLERTTQMARLILRKQMRRHIKPRFPHMNVTRIDEPVSTDPLLTNCRSMCHGYTAAQVFFGTKSHTIFMYGIKSKGEFPTVYRDFIREHGAPSALRRDNAKEEQSELVKEINREFMIKDQLTEPYHPQQNPVETKAIRFLKGQVLTVLDQTGEPDSMWYMAAQYVADVHNICSDSKLPNAMTPLQYQSGVTPDISAYLQFTFWQAILYLDHESDWPASKERSGRWLGIAKGIGDLLTFWILDDQSKNILARSVVRPFSDNLRVKWDPELSENPSKYKAKVVNPNYVNLGLEDNNLQPIGPTDRAQGRLRLHTEVIPVDNTIESYVRGKMQPYKKVHYKDDVYEPPVYQDHAPVLRHSTRLLTIQNDRLTV